jgi:hypothetical protein
MLKVLAEVECKSTPEEELTIAGPLDDLPAILRRESVYCALGRLSRALASFGGIDFNAFLQHASSWLGQGVPLYVSPSPLLPLDLRRASPTVQLRSLILVTES